MIEATIKYLESEVKNLELQEELKNWISDETFDSKIINIGERPSILLIK
jgi:hypothetical protein